MKRLACGAALLATACASAPPVRQLGWSEIAARTPQPAAVRVAYGAEPQQFGELRLPAGQGPFPVAMLIHGGCWLAEYDYRYMGHLGDALARVGVASWNIEYRRVGDKGGGWPGTFRDVATAADRLAGMARDYPLDLSRAIVMGHSAGGQLALWTAGRPSFPPGIMLYRPDPIRFGGVVGLAPITDLVNYSRQKNCGEAVVPLIGGKPEEYPDRYSQVSPAERLPILVRQRLIAAEHDPVVPLAGIEAYAERARYVKDDARVAVVKGASHFDLLTEDGAGWAAVRAAVTELLQLP